MTEMVCEGFKMQFFPDENGKESHTILNDRIYISNSRFEILPPKTKEDNMMKASYKNVTGILQKLERVKEYPPRFTKNGEEFDVPYILEIWDNEKECKVSFPIVYLKDVKFLGGEVTYG